MPHVERIAVHLGQLAYPASTTATQCACSSSAVKKGFVLGGSDGHEPESV